MTANPRGIPAPAPTSTARLLFDPPSSAGGTTVGTPEVEAIARVEEMVVGKVVIVDEVDELEEVCKVVEMAEEEEGDDNDVTFAWVAEVLLLVVVLEVADTTVVTIVPGDSLKILVDTSQQPGFASP